jgi:hypothetical protein
MSIQAFKKKGVINYGSKRSGKPPGGYWLTQGPFGGKLSSVGAPGPVGFSINGGTRNIGYVGKESKFSKQGTPFYGQFAKGSGGIRGTYPRTEPIFNALEAIVLGSQYQYIKPSVLSTKGMLEKRFKWINNGQYPNHWVQPVYPTGTQSDNASQGLYVQTKAAQNITVNNTNKPQKFLFYYKKGGPFGCRTQMGGLNYKIAESNGPYTKDLYIPQDASQYTLQVQRRCANPSGSQKPFPFATNGGSNNSGPGINFAPPPVSQQVYLTPPAWYTRGNANNQCSIIS